MSLYQEAGGRAAPPWSLLLHTLSEGLEALDLERKRNLKLKLIMGGNRGWSTRSAWKGDRKAQE